MSLQSERLLNHMQRLRLSHLPKSLFTIFMHRGVEASRQLYAAMRLGP